MRLLHQLEDPSEPAHEPQAGGWRELAPKTAQTVWKSVRSRPARDLPLAVMIGAAISILGLALGRGHVPIPIFPAPLYAGFLIDLIRLSWREWRVPPQVEAMFDLPESGNQFPVRVCLWHKGVQYGEDSGVLSVLWGGIYFSGEQTEFTLSRRTAWLSTRTASHASPIHPPESYSVSFQSGEFEGRAVFVPLGQSSEDRDALKSKICRALQQWDSTPESKAWERTIDPPIVPQPGRLRNQAVSALGAAVFFAGGLLVAGWLAFAYFTGRFHARHMEEALIYVMLPFVGLMLFGRSVKAVRGLKAMERRGAG